MTAVVAPPQKSENRAAYEKAVERLRVAPNIRDIIEESAIDAFVPTIEADLRHRQ
jgi:hypothetical protein